MITHGLRIGRRTVPTVVFFGKGDIQMNVTEMTEEGTVDLYFSVASEFRPLGSVEEVVPSLSDDLNINCALVFDDVASVNALIYMLEQVKQILKPDIMETIAQKDVKQTESFIRKVFASYDTKQLKAFADINGISYTDDVERMRLLDSIVEFYIKSGL